MMANHEHLEILKKGVEVWNEWRTDNLIREVDFYGAKLKGANLINVNLKGADLRWADLRWTDLVRANIEGANLKDANLSKANLLGADLRYASLLDANLKGVDLRWADLRWTDFRRANLINADLIWADLLGADFLNADLRGANLKGANIRTASLINANFSDADISGACIDDANLSGWIIKGIKCSHLVRNQKKTPPYNDGEFEKINTQIEKEVELILNAPFSDLTHYTGRIIEKIINEKFGDGSLMFNRHEAISNIDNQEQTKQKFIAFDEKKVNDIQGQLSKFGDKLNLIFSEIRDQKKTKGNNGFKDEIDISFMPGLVLRKDEIEKIFNDKEPENIKGFSKLSPLIQKIMLAFKI